MAERAKCTIRLFCDKSNPAKQVFSMGHWLQVYGIDT
jgi:hypothetical protein